MTNKKLCTDYNQLFFSPTETTQKIRLLKKSAHLILLNSLEKALWNWIEYHPQEFADVQRTPNEELSKYCLLNHQSCKYNNDDPFFQVL